MNHSSIELRDALFSSYGSSLPAQSMRHALVALHNVLPIAEKSKPEYAAMCKDAASHLAKAYGLLLALDELLLDEH